MMSLSKSLCLKKFSPEVLTPPNAAAQARFETANIVINPT
jgi:hypothetical protein